MSMGKTLKAWRAQDKLRPEPIAALLNVSRQTIHNWENDKGRPSLEHLRKMEEYHPGLLRMLGLKEMGDAKRP